MIIRDYEAMTLKQVTGELIGALLVYQVFRLGQTPKYDLQQLLRAYIAKGGKNPKAAELLANLEGK